MLECPSILCGSLKWLCKLVQDFCPLDIKFNDRLPVSQPEFDLLARAYLLDQLPLLFVFSYQATELIGDQAVLLQLILRCEAKHSPCRCQFGHEGGVRVFLLVRAD